MNSFTPEQKLIHDEIYRLVKDLFPRTGNDNALFSNIMIRQTLSAAKSIEAQRKRLNTLFQLFLLRDPNKYPLPSFAELGRLQVLAALTAIGMDPESKAEVARTELLLERLPAVFGQLRLMGRSLDTELEEMLKAKRTSPESPHR